MKLRQVDKVIAQHAAQQWSVFLRFIFSPFFPPIDFFFCRVNTVYVFNIVWFKGPCARSVVEIVLKFRE